MAYETLNTYSGVFTEKGHTGNVRSKTMETSKLRIREGFFVPRDTRCLEKFGLLGTRRKGEG